VIVNDPGDDEKTEDHEEIYGEPIVNIDPSLDKGKGNESHWFEGDECESSLLARNNPEQHFDEHAGGADELLPCYSSIHPQHRARVQAWREENLGSDVPME
jgi:hypothetical protein